MPGGPKNKFQNKPKATFLPTTTRRDKHTCIELKKQKPVFVLTHNAPAPRHPVLPAAQAARPSPHPSLSLAMAWTGAGWLCRRGG